MRVQPALQENTASQDVMTTMEDARWIMENIPLKQPTYDF